MQYMGSKNRHAKDLLPIVLKHRTPGQWYVEPFVGGANMIDKVDGNRAGNDSHAHLIALLQHVQNGGDLPEFVSEDDYMKAKEQSKTEINWLIGFIGFGCTFGSKWMAGYARNKNGTNYARMNRNNLLKQAANLKGIHFTNKSYLELEFKRPCIIYNDPPYEGTTKYKGVFDHVVFWDWVRKMCGDGHTVYTSEYSAPDDFISVWEKPTLANFSMQNNDNKDRTEKLFIHKSQMHLL